MATGKPGRPDATGRGPASQETCQRGHPTGGRGVHTERSFAAVTTMPVRSRERSSPTTLHVSVARASVTLNVSFATGLGLTRCAAIRAAQTKERCVMGTKLLICGALVALTGFAATAAHAAKQHRGAAPDRCLGKPHRRRNYRRLPPASSPPRTSRARPAPRCRICCRKKWASRPSAPPAARTAPARPSTCAASARPRAPTRWSCSTDAG